MSGRFVRASKFRHVHGEPAKKTFSNLRVVGDGDGNFIKASKKFFCYSQVGGGGPVVVYPLKNPPAYRMDSAPHVINVHKAKVLDFDFSPFLDNLLATASEDQSIKITLFPEDGITSDITEAAASLEGHQKKVSLIHFNPVANNILGSTGYDMSLKIWDITRPEAAAISYDDHTDVVMSFEWNENGSLVATTCKDKQLRFFDPRQAKATLQSAGSFVGVKPAKVVWLENHSKLAVVGFSATSMRQYSVYDPRKMTEGPLLTADIDQGAGAFITYYDSDNSVLYLAGKGDTGIRYFEVVDEEPYIHFLSEFRSTEPQKGVAFLPKLACESKDCEIAVGLRLLKDQIQPVSFQVPRKSDLFQADIYPDTFAGVPSLTEAEWLAGGIKEPIKLPFREAQAKSGSTPAAASMPSQPSKSAAQLSKELAEAHDRIAALEAELAALKASK